MRLKRIAATESYVINPAALNGVFLLGWWMVGKNATDLTNPATLILYLIPLVIGSGVSVVRY
jgi:hypothetical protein